MVDTPAGAGAFKEHRANRRMNAAGDLVVWDTPPTVHAATAINVATLKHDARLLWRVSVRGWPAVHGAVA